MGAGSFFKGKPGGVMERIAFEVYTKEGCVCKGVITLNSRVFGNAMMASAHSFLTNALDPAIPA
eukprot:1158190-Pelagomonas_calceolata.AAC.10